MFDYDAKYSGESQEICPGNFSSEEEEELEKLAALAHKALNLSHYSRSDFIVSPNRGVYFLESNTLPGLTKESLLPKALEAVGVSVKEFLHHVLRLAHRTGVWL
jgi:D-alanine-D-alanine ligase